MPNKVILAHDVACNAAGVKQVLIRHGYDTRLVHDGESLLTLAEKWRPGSAVIDLGMDGRKGLETGKALRAKFGGDIQIVGFTEPSAPQLENEALSAGFDHVVVNVGDSAEFLLALAGPGATLVRRAQGASYAFANEILGHARVQLARHADIADARARRRNLGLLRRAVECIGRHVQGDVLEFEQRHQLRLELSQLESDIQRLARDE